MDKNTKVTIVIPVYNGEKFLKKAIKSALNQTYKNIEIIVVNDGSTDKTEKIALSFKNKIKYLKKENGGVASALNIAIKNMDGDYFSWLSHDDEYYPEKVEKQVSLIKQLNKPNIILYSNYEMMSANGKVYKRIIHNHYELQKHHELSLLQGCINGITLLIPKEAFMTCGLFNENLWCTQDYDKWLDMIFKYRFWHMEDVLVKTRIHDKQTTNTSNAVVKEGNILWKKILHSFDDKKILEIFDSMEKFYKEMILFFENSPYDEMRSYTEELLNNLTKE